MIKQHTFREAVNQFDKLEKRSNFFTLATNLIHNSFDVEGYILLLATWNFALFRYAMKQFDIEQFRKSLLSLKEPFSRLEHYKIESADLDRSAADIKNIFTTLSKIEGVKFTGAPKLMHLKNPNLFVMWDEYIRGGKSKKYYDNLEIVTTGQCVIEKYGKDADGYFRFLKDMQCRFSHLSSPSKTKTMAKAIDEFNYVTITLPIQKAMKLAKQSGAG